jgi:hypothetical protein
MSEKERPAPSEGERGEHRQLMREMYQSAMHAVEDGLLTEQEAWEGLNYIGEQEWGKRFTKEEWSGEDD